jgi:hypothetical protein
LTELPGNPQPVVTQAEFARIRGVTRQAISKMVRAGTLAGDAVTDDGRIDVAAATLQLGPPPDRPRRTRDRPDKSSDDPAYAESRARREAANAELAEIELAEARGELIDKTAAAHALERQVRRLRDRILIVAIDAAPSLARAADETACESILRLALEQALQDTADHAADPDSPAPADTA